MMMCMYEMSCYDMMKSFMTHNLNDVIDDECMNVYT